jgi:hypothetical protein
VFCENCVAKFATASGSVSWFGLVNTSSGSRYWFQLFTNVSTVTVASAGRHSGSRIRTKNWIRVAPSTTAASSSSPGIARMNGRRITIVMGSPNAPSARARPYRLSSSPILSSSR